MRLRIGLKQKTWISLALGAALLPILSACFGAPQAVQTSLSAGAEQQRGFCEAGLKAAFESTYRPLLTDSSLCLSCHTDGGASPFKFASPDLTTAFSAFLQVGADRVGVNATNPTHAPGRTGPALETQFSQAHTRWIPAYAEFERCLGSSGGSDALNAGNKSSSDLYFGDGRTATLTWQLSDVDITPSTARFPATFSIDVRVDYQNVGGEMIAVGYVFTNPRLSMLTGEFEVEIEGLIVRINDVQAPGIEPFLSARRTFRGVDPQNLYSGQVRSALPVVTSGDKFSVSFGYVHLRARTDNPPIPPTPVLAARNAFTRTAQVPVSISNDATARRWCLTASTSRPNSTAEPCPGFEGATTNGWLTARPANFDLAALGRAVTSGETVSFYLWVANSDLKISAGAGVTQVTFDTTAPVGLTLAALAVTDTQIADLTGLQDPNEPVTWCVLESSAQTGVERSDNCSFGATKPAFVGLRGGGTRYVAVFARDRAGNISRSEIRTATNPFGRITFQQLNDVAQGARAVFLNRCASCHGTTMPQQALWDSSLYADTVAKRTSILNRIDSATQPMPPTGLLDAKERALIRLWYTQTSTPVEQ